ncbi:palmitoyltransferase ZDHHC12 [Ahaetulla prasina]|uniref:palmitoyltransferase ZDHHC12 n=1 Tax=Ahaetulla prasina TaxID=499056 RepID=UPI0026477F6D|nr:palmitoyltransferase ZDHHC12 [Ahaetulla prasina]
MRPGAPAGGGWAVRAAQTGLSWGVTVGLFLHDTDLRRQLEQGKLLQPLSFTLLVLSSVVLYFVVSLMNPGYVEDDGGDEKGSMAGEEKAKTFSDAPNVRLRRCGYCMVKQPLRAKHCQACQQCVRRYDHHCPWIENCIGERNHPFFVLYLGVQLAVLLWALQVAWSGLNFQSFSWLWLQCHLLLLLSFLLLIICTVIATLLLGSHLYLVSCNTTTWEFMSRHRISYLKHCKVENPFDQGILLNLWRFFCACRLMAWEKLYPSEESELV